jgi:hypothetical protein
VNCARWDLCGGRSVMGVSTAIARGLALSKARPGVLLMAKRGEIDRSPRSRKRLSFMPVWLWDFPIAALGEGRVTLRT